MRGTKSLFAVTCLVSGLFSQVTLIVETDTTTYDENQPIEIFITLINYNDDTLNIILPFHPPQYWYIDSTLYETGWQPVIIPLSINPFDQYTFVGIHGEYVNPGVHTLTGGLYYYLPDYVGGLQSIESDKIMFEVSTTIHIKNETALPKSIYLARNYPNPFNPTTTIQYELPQRSDVQITIYDLLGRKVTTLVNQTQDAGFQSVTWNATNDRGKPVSAGVYLYQIRAGEFAQTKKMVLLK